MEKQVDPNQVSLDQMLASATRVEMLEPTVNPETRRLVGNVVYVTESQEDIDGLRQALHIIEDPSMFGHCMCTGSPWLAFYRETITNRGQKRGGIGSFHELIALMGV